MTATITRQDLIVERSTTTWGGPVARVTVQFPNSWTDEPQARTFELKSTEGLDNIPLGAHAIHIGEVGEHAMRQEWRGAFKTLDMDTAIGYLVEYLNELLERQAAERATENPLLQLSGALSDFGESLNDTSGRDFRQEWIRVRETFVAVDLAMAAFRSEDQ